MVQKKRIDISFQIDRRRRVFLFVGHKSVRCKHQALVISAMGEQME